jgi:hypothetical protein
MPAVRMVATITTDITVSCMVARMLPNSELIIAIQPFPLSSKKESIPCIKGYGCGIELVQKKRSMRINHSAGGFSGAFQSGSAPPIRYGSARPVSF